MSNGFSLRNFRPDPFVPEVLPTLPADVFGRQSQRLGIGLLNSENVPRAFSFGKGFAFWTSRANLPFSLEGCCEPMSDPGVCVGVQQVRYGLLYVETRGHIHDVFHGSLFPMGSAEFPAHRSGIGLSDQFCLHRPAWI